MLNGEYDILNNFIKELESLTKELTAEEEMILNNLNKLICYTF